MKCALCDWKVPNDETWDEKAAEHYEATNHGSFITQPENLPNDDY